MAQGVSAATAAREDCRTATRKAFGEAGLPYVPALDGLRALAVIAVLLYHAGVAWMPGGFLGVEVFFVISGFLITSLLLAEYRKTSRVNLRRFWLRRARRLLPAVFLMMAATIAFTIAFLPEEVAGLRADALAATGYVTNWHLVFAQESYFEAVGRPSLLKHLWSLAVEEQFYIVWPVVVAAGLAVLRRGGVLSMTILGAAASAALVVYLFEPGVDPSRIYYGTDTRAAGLLIGAALAFFWLPGKGFRHPNTGGATTFGGKLRRKLGWTRPAALDLAGLVALGSLVWLGMNLGEFDPFLYKGGLVLVSVATAVVLAAAVHPHAHLGLLGVGPLRWIGVRSYGIYLWHWPIFMVTRPGLDVAALEGSELLALRLVATVALADLSYRYVEKPIRRGSLGKAWRDLRTSRGYRKMRLGVQWSAATVACSAFCVVLAVNIVSAEAPERPGYLDKDPIEAEFSANRSEEATDEPKGGSNPDEPSREENRASENAELKSSEPESAEAGGGGTSDTASPPSVEGPVTAIGDSVMLGASDRLEEDIEGFTVTDAATGMQAADAIQILTARRDAGELGETVVVHIGNNDPITDEEFDEIMEILSDTPRVVLVNVRVPLSWEASNNELLREKDEEYEKISLVDWNSASYGHPEYFWDDGIHARPEGADVYAELIRGVWGDEAVRGLRFPKYLSPPHRNFLYTPMFVVSRTPRASLSSFNVAPRRSMLMAKVWRSIIGYTRGIPTCSHRFKMAFCNDFEVTTGRAARPTMSSGVSSFRRSKYPRRASTVPGVSRAARGARCEPGPPS
jgi:peptidoglycan/LPS O-acetylase OafA/YrhL